jgi:hypothetical protein
LQIDERRKAQGTRRKEENTALFLTIPVGASFACDRRIYELRGFGFRYSIFEFEVGEAHPTLVEQPD